MTNLGDKIASFATPIARAVDSVFGTDIENCGGCKKMRDNLNAGMTFTDAIYQRWFAAKQQGEKMKYQIVVVVEAEKASEATAKGESIGEVMALQVRPEPQARPAQPQSIRPQ